MRLRVQVEDSQREAAEMDPKYEELIQEVVAEQNIQARTYGLKI